MANDPNVLSKYIAGFNECSSEVGKYLQSLDGMSIEVKSKLLGHLAGCLQRTSTAVSPPSSINSFPNLQFTSGQPQSAVTTLQLPSATALSTLPGGPGVCVFNPGAGTAALPASIAASPMQLVPAKLPTGETVFLLANSTQTLAMTGTPGLITPAGNMSPKLPTGFSANIPTSASVQGSLPAGLPAGLHTAFYSDFASRTSARPSASSSTSPLVIAPAHSSTSGRSDSPSCSQDTEHDSPREKRHPEPHGNQCPQDHRGNSQDHRGNPQDLSGNPQDARGNFQNLRGNPQDLRGNPQDHRGNPQDHRENLIGAGGQGDDDDDSYHGDSSHDDSDDDVDNNNNHNNHHPHQFQGHNSEDEDDDDPWRPW